MGSANVQVFGLGNDPETPKWTAAALGGIRDGDSSNYPLMRPDEVGQFLGKDHPTQIVIRTTGAPLKLERLAYQKVGAYRGLSLKDLHGEETIR